jgi:hypothetical protein
VTHTITWFDDSPDVGNCACVCSWCGELITEDDGLAIRVFDTQANKEARFHLRCAGPSIGIVAERSRADLSEEFEL